MGLCDWDLYFDVTSNENADREIIYPPEITREELNVFIMKCVFWLEYKDPNWALCIVRRYGLDGKKPQTLFEIGKIWDANKNKTEKARLVIHKALKSITRAHKSNFDIQLLRPL